jgi:site-specific recombinase XerD
MPGLTFDDTPPPDPDSPLVLWLDEWIESIARHSRKTVAGYVSDVAGFAATLLGVVGKPLPEVHLDSQALSLVAADAGVANAAARFGFKPGSYVRAQAAFGALVLVDLHPKHLARAVNRYQADHAAASTRRAAAAWSSFCRYLTGQQVLAANPMDSATVQIPHRPSGDPAPLTYEEAQRVFDVCGQPDPSARHPWPARDLAAAALFVATGVRCEEAISAAVGDFFDETGVGTRLRVWGKGGKPRTIPVHDEAALAVRAYLLERVERLGRTRPDDPLLVRHDGTAFSASAMYRLVQRWYARAAVRRHPGACIHALRHTFGTQALDSGASIVEVQQLMGHRSLETTKRYLDVVGGGLEETIAGHASRRLLRLAREGTSGQRARPSRSPVDARAAAPE